jgi:hypothetical protein
MSTEDYAEITVRVLLYTFCLGVHKMSTYWGSHVYQHVLPHFISESIKQIAF